MGPRTFVDDVQRVAEEEFLAVRYAGPEVDRVVLPELHLEVSLAEARQKHTLGWLLVVPGFPARVHPHAMPQVVLDWIATSLGRALGQHPELE